MKYPDFIGIGVAKAATVWIWECLREHPEICMGRIKTKVMKEINFFNESYNYKKGLKYYSSLFNQCPENMKKGEFTPDYMFSPYAPILIKRHFPNIKLIACLRNPVDRAYSHYKYDIEVKGPLSIYKSFEEAILRNKSFLETGLYFKQLKRYFELFQKKNILVVFFNDLIKDPVKFIHTIYEFLDLKNSKFIPTYIRKKVHSSGYRIVKYKIPFINPLIYRYIDRTGGWKRRMTNNSSFECLIDRFNLKEYIAKFVLFNKIFKHKKNKRILSFSKVNYNTRKYLIKNIYLKDIEKLEKLLNKDLSYWKQF